MARPSPTLDFPLSPGELVKWCRFATTKGGIGRAVALVDRLADSDVDLMFLRTDEIVILYALEDNEHFLGYCEGVCGRLRRDDVQIIGRLKRPVFTTRSRSYGDQSAPVGVETPPDSPLEHPGLAKSTAPVPSGGSARSSSVSSHSSMARVRSASGDTTGTSAHTHSLAESYRFGSAGHVDAAEAIERIAPDEDVDNLADYYRYSRHDDEVPSFLALPAHTMQPSSPNMAERLGETMLAYLVDTPEPSPQPASRAFDPPRSISPHRSSSLPPPAWLGPSAVIGRPAVSPPASPTFLVMPPTAAELTPRPMGRARTESGGSQRLGASQTRPLRISSRAGSSSAASSPPVSPLRRSLSLNAKPSSAPGSPLRASRPSPSGSARASISRKGSISSVASLFSRRPSIAAGITVDQISAPQPIRPPSASRPAPAPIVVGTAAFDFVVPPAIGAPSDDEGEDDAAPGPAVRRATRKNRAIYCQSMIADEAGLTPFGRPPFADLDTDDGHSRFGRPSVDASLHSSLPPSMPESTAALTAASLAAHRAREAKWLSVLSGGSRASTKTLKRLVRAGIPPSVRSRAWAHLVGVAAIRNPTLYHDLGARNPTPVHAQIDRELDRCCPNHPLFQSHDSTARLDLASVLKAYALYDPSVGFNEGLGSLAGVLLLYVPAEDAFWLLVALVRKHLAGYHARDGRRIRTAAFALGKLLNDVDADVSKRLQRAGVAPEEWTTSWLQSCFSCRVLPLPTLLRVLDCFMLEGPRFLFRVALSMFDVLQDPLLDPRTDVRLVLYRPDPDALEVHVVLSAALLTKVRESSLRRLLRRGEAYVKEQDRARSRPSH